MFNSETKETKEWFPHCIINGEGLSALLILNQPLSEETKLFLKRIWKSVPLHVAVDGGANQLAQLSDNDASYIPELVCGDFDSATPEVLDFFKQKGAKVIHTPDQDETDFTKALRLTKEYLKKVKMVENPILAISNNGERLDHIIGNLNTLFLADEILPVPVLILGCNSLTWLLSPGHHQIHFTEDFKNSHVGLIPLGSKCSDVSTTGLVWNLDHGKMNFGGLISTCNRFDGSEMVTVTTDSPLIWTMEISLNQNKLTS